MQDREKLTGEELEQAFQEGVNYLGNLKGKHEVVFESGTEGEMSVFYPKMGEYKILIEFPTGREAYIIDLSRGLKEIHVPAREVIRTEALGDFSPFPHGWMEHKTFLEARSIEDYRGYVEDQKLLALTLIDKLRAGIRQ